jgi:hypothetical protein
VILEFQADDSPASAAVERDEHIIISVTKPFNFALGYCPSVYVKILGASTARVTWLTWSTTRATAVPRTA